MASDNKDHLGQNDRKESHYNLKQYKGLVDLDLIPITVFNRIVCNLLNFLLSYKPIEASLLWIFNACQIKCFL
jgi:hypothetical protein